ncbi:hypothetical protein ACF0H5_018909 [Mactra antiquata]
MIMPILSYGAEVWGFHKSPDIEKVHLKFLRQILGVHNKTTSSAVYGEFGRFPLYIKRQIRIIKYWHRINKLNNSLMYKLMYMTDNNGILVNSWSINVKTLLSNLGFLYLWANPDISNLQINNVIQRVIDNYLQSWYACLNSFSRLETYKFFKISFEFEKYLDCIENDKYISVLARFRCSSHKLAIEEGRCRNIDKNLRLCKLCNMNQIESEYHFLLICPIYNELRKKYLHKYFYTWPNLNKFRILLNTTNCRKIIKLASFIYSATNLRNSLI